jgi:ribosome-associated translation inhibitor RaiA
VLNVKIATEGYELTDELRQRAVDKFGSLDQYIRGLERVHVSFAWSGGKGEGGPACGERIPISGATAIRYTMPLRSNTR